jgi:DNA-directed RNA polymerase III subunit RPC6
MSWAGDDEEDEEENRERGDERRKKPARRPRHSRDDSLHQDEESASDSDADGAKKGKGKEKEKKGRKGSRNDIEGKGRKLGKKRKTGDGGGDDDDDDEREEARRKKRRLKAEDTSSGSEQSEREAMRLIDPVSGEAITGGAYAYRAIRPEEPSSVLGWAQAPCSRCPVFDFCKPDGPVNPRECTYFDEAMEVAVRRLT